MCGETEQASRRSFSEGLQVFSKKRSGKAGETAPEEADFERLGRCRFLPFFRGDASAAGENGFCDIPRRGRFHSGDFPLIAVDAAGRAPSHWKKKRNPPHGLVPPAPSKSGKVPVGFPLGLSRLLRALLRMREALYAAAPPLTRIAAGQEICAPSSHSQRRRFPLVSRSGPGVPFSP